MNVLYMPPHVYNKHFCDCCINCRWYEAAAPWMIGNNQGIEGTNKAIKASHTFKRRAPTGEIMDIVGGMVKWIQDDVPLKGSKWAEAEN